MIDLHHPITPPTELVMQWLEDGPEDGEFGISKHIATQAARWGSDQELEACCEYLTRCAAWEPEDIQEMRDLRRPEPPSLKKLAYDALDTYIYGEPDPKDKERTYNIIRRALESLPS